MPADDGTLLEYLAGKALEQHRLDLDEHRRSPEYVDAAGRMASESVGKWFPPVSWEVLDHTLHLAPAVPSAVLVRPVDDKAPAVDVRLLITQKQDNGPLGSVYVVHAITPGEEVRAIDPPAALTHALIRQPVDLGLWVEERKTARLFGGSVNPDVARKV